MSGNVLGGLNNDAKLSAGDWTAYRNMVEEAILSRLLLSTGSPPSTLPTTGICDVIDPGVISGSETSRPLLVTLSNLNPLQLQIYPGTVVTPSGAIVSVASLVFSLALARLQANDVNIVFLENVIASGGTQFLNDYNLPLSSQDVQEAGAPKVALLGDWNNVSLFPPDRKKNIVVIAVAVVIPTVSGGLQVQIDLTRNTYSYNRPWFSIKDLQHRSYVGSGTVTTENPHGTALNDLSTAGNVNLFQGTTDTGMIVSRDRTISKMVGALYCTEQVPLNRILLDTSGTVTAKSPYGKVNAKYCLLLGFPTRLGSVYEAGTQSNSISAEVIEGTNILVFGPNETLPLPLTVEYTETNALLPPPNAPTNLLVFGVPGTDELITAGGLTFASISNPQVNLEGSGPFPRQYTVYFLDNGTLVAYPQILIPATFVSVIGTSLYAPPQPMAHAARIRVGLTKASPISTTDLQVTIYGKDINGNAQQEIIRISVANGYVDETPPSTNYDSAAQQVVSTHIYSVVNNIQVTSITDVGPQALIQVWADMEPGTTPALNDSAKVALLSWNGQGIAQIEDLRVISKGFYRMPRSLEGATMLDAGRLLNALQVSPILTSTSLLLMTEDFEDLRYFDSSRGFSGSTEAKGVMTINTNGFLTAGDTIVIAPGKTLTATTGVANPAVGQFQLGVTAGATAANMIATVNDTTFNSGILATLGINSNVNLQFKLTGPYPGSLGNAVTITATLANFLAMSFSGFQGGYDAFGECYFDRSVTGLKSPQIPGNSNLTPAAYLYRVRYRSRGVALPNFQGPKQKFAVEIHGQDKFHPTSVRMRGSYVGQPDQWTPWQLMTVASPGFGGLYLSSFTQPVHKVQVEYYGRARGCSVYNL